MSLIIAQDLLKQYNKNSPYTRIEPTASQADQNSKKFGTWSYANMYDALYNKFSSYKNFNMDMWHQAIKLGEQDQYLALLEQNKDTTLSDKFYDPQYYDYESMMLELYKPLANATNKTERFQDTYDQVTQSWVEESLGEMSDQEYIQYQLNQAKEIRAAEITRDLEQWRKDQLNFWQKLGHDVIATVGEFHEGLLSALVGITDFVIAAGTVGVVPYAAAGFKGNYLDAFVDYFGEKSLTALEKQTLRAALDEYEKTHTHFRDIDGNITGIGKYFTGIANSIGMMVPAIVANYFTAGIGGTAGIILSNVAGTAVFYSSIFSSNMYENATNPYIANSPSWLKIGNAALKTGVEAVVEWALSKIFGGTIQNKLLGIGGRNIGQEVIKGFGKTSGIKYFLKSAGQEGLEEFLQDFSTNCVDQFTELIYEGYGNTGVTIQTLIDSFCIGVLSSMLMSGGHIAINETKSAIQNKIKPGSGDLLIETKDGPKKVRGFNKLYYSSILSDFQNAVDELKVGKMSSAKNIELAQEVYGAMSAISQFYSSFDAERIKRCEMLLDRVIKAEKFEQNHERAASILSEKTIKKATKREVKEAAQTLGRNIETAFRSMVGDVALRHANKLHSVVEKEEVTTALEKGGVTEATAFIDTDGIRYQKDPDVIAAEEKLGKKAIDIIKELRKGYEWVITVDGHIAYETDGYLFVSEAWLQNYTVSDIYKYLEQTRVLKTLTAKDTLLPAAMIEKLIAFDKEFTGQTDVDAERAMMDLLFNKSVYQAFLLSNAGENMHEFKDFIFQLHDMMKDIASGSKHHQQLFKGKQSQTRINMLNQIYEQIKETMREPTIKAILNWGLVPQNIGADSVLTPRDREVINKYKEYRRTITGKGSKSAYEHLKEDIIAKADFNDREFWLVSKSGTGELSIDEEIEARALLDEADRRMTSYDFEASPKASLAKSYAQRFANRYTSLLTGGDVDVQLYVSLLNDMRESTSVWYDSRVKHTPGYLQAAQAWEDNLDKYGDSLITRFGDNWLSNITFEDLKPYIETGIKFYQRAAAELAGKGSSYAQGLGAFTIPYQAAAMALDDPASAQFVTDQLNEFEQIYGISARQMITGDLTGMSMAQRNQLTQDMEMLEIDSYVIFVIKKLEGMLGGTYIVTPTRKQLKPRTTTNFSIVSNDDTGIYDFVIAKSIPAEQFISQDILEEDIETRNAIFEETCTSAANVQKRAIYREEIRLAFYNKLSEEDRAMLEYLSQLSDRDINDLLDTLVRYNDAIINTKHYDTTVKATIISPLTGEMLTDKSPIGDLFIKIRNRLSASPMALLSDFIDISNFPTIDLENVKVYFEDAGPNAAGWALGNKIVIDPHKSNDYFGTLVHEINHIMQAKYNMPNGFNPDTARAMPDFLAYVVNHYPNYIKYTLYRAGYDEQIEIPNIGTVTEKDIKRMPSYLKDLVAHCAYMLVQGEFWARGYDHNGKMVHGFTETWSGIGDTYLLAPDGKTKFKVRYNKKSSASSTSYMSDIVAGSALDVAIQKAFFIRGRMTRGEISSRNTYHSNYTGSKSKDMIEKLLGEDAPRFAKYTTTLNTLILNPNYLLSEIKSKLNGDFSEGNVYYRVKEYVEANFDGVSIDRTANSHEYIFVDDNAFDDLYLPDIRKKTTSTDTYLVDKYKDRDSVALSEFYSPTQLALLGITSKTRVIIRDDVSTETVFDEYAPYGEVYINSKEYSTDAEFLDALNHEFRHVLQHFHGFESGFTPDFKVTPEMIADVKAHAPGLFKNEKIVNAAKRHRPDAWEEDIVQRFVYNVIGGEIEAYALPATELYVKPGYATIEAGNPTIFMPWYNAKTGEGRYKTEFLAARAKKIDGDTKKKVALPKVDKSPKHIAVKVESLDEVDQVRTYVYNTRRDFTAKKAKGTNLEYFVKKGQRNQMDPDLQKFIIATTGHEDKLPPELWNVIGGTHKGTLTKQALFKWFRQAKTVNEFTFDLLNKYMFKNNYITSMTELDAMLTVDPSFYWASAVVLRKEGLALESLLADNDVDNFLSFINSIEGSKWKAKIEELQVKFNEQWIKDGKGGYKKEDIGYSDRVQAYMRVLAMQWFDGTLAGAFYVANAFRKTARKYEEEIRGVTSLDAKRSNNKGDKETTIGDTISSDVTLSGDYKAVANDILAIYENDTSKSEDEMLEELSLAYYERLCEKANIDPQSKDKDKLMPIAQKVLKYRRKLAELSIDEISVRYSELTNAEITNTQTTEGVFADTKQNKDSRISIVDRIKRRGKKLLKYIREGKIAFSDLPKDVQNMFELTTATTDSGKKTEVYELKSSVYSVGRGRNKLPGMTDKTGRLNYAPKHNITEGNEAFRHDTSTILANLERLDMTVKAANQVIAERKGMTKKLVARGERAAKTLTDAIRAKKAPKKEYVRTTEFKTTKNKKRTSDTPNIFNIVSAIDMPYQLRKIFDTSFEELADTKVQFASRDESGQLYDESQFKPGEFDSRVKHEVSNWDAFYEANRDALLSLTRSDILDIVEFFQRGMGTIDGPANKLAAFEIFLLGYIVDGARRNINNWDFSDAEIEMVEKLYEQKASAHGSGLQAVQQMLKVVDPMKKVRQRMFDDWTEISDDDKDRLIKAVDDLQHETNTDTRIKKAVAVQEMLKEFGQRQRIGPNLKYVSAKIRKLIDAGTIDPNTLSKEVLQLLALGDAITNCDLEELIERDKAFDKLLHENRELKRLVGTEVRRWSRAWWGRAWSKVKSWRYMAMLSGPTTWIRNNGISNPILTVFNKTSDIIARFVFMKKGYRKEQWNLAGVKISPEAKNFIDTHIRNNPIFSPSRKELKDGAPNLYNLYGKYDPSQSKKVADEKSLLVSLIAKAYEKQYAQDHRFDTKVMNGVAKFIDKMISDEKFVKFTAGRYFGKILTIEAQRGNIDLSQGLSHEAMELFANSVLLANQEYMHKRSFAADFLDGIRDKHPAMYEALTMWQPFINSSLNWYIEILKYTPVGFAGSIIRACRLEKQITKLDERRAKGEMVTDSRAAEFFIRRDIGKGILGLILSGLGGILVLSGCLRIDEEDDKFYMYIKDIKLDITNIFGSSALLIGASVVQVWIKRKEYDSVGAALEDLLSLLTDVMLEGFFATDLLDRHKWGGTWDDILTETESVMRSFVPQIWQTIIACTNHEKIRYSAGFKGMWERWLNSFVPTQPAGNRKINPYTGEVEDKYSLPIVGGLLQKGVLGPKIYWVEVSENERMCRELEVNKNELTGELTVNKNKYELDRLTLNKKYGELNKESLTKIKSQKHKVEMPNGTFKTLSWDDMSDEQRANVISRTMTRNADIAKIYMWTQVMNKKYYASDSLWQTLKQLGITQNIYKGDKGFVE